MEREPGPVRAAPERQERGRRDRDAVAVGIRGFDLDAARRRLTGGAVLECCEVARLDPRKPVRASDDDRDHQRERPDRSGCDDRTSGRQPAPHAGNPNFAAPKDCSVQPRRDHAGADDAGEKGSEHEVARKAEPQRARARPRAREVPEREARRGDRHLRQQLQLTRLRRRSLPSPRRACDEQPDRHDAERDQQKSGELD